MANCKFCHQSVKTGKVWHAACWEAKVNKMAEIFCDEYCRFPREIKDPDALEDTCNGCKLISLLNMGL